jgi:3'(2'), 5'-bisphosphate nucleotidase
LAWIRLNFQFKGSDPYQHLRGVFISKMLDLKSEETQFAIRAVREASRLVRQVQAELVSPALTKEDRSPVTVADFASQALVGRMISLDFPEDLLAAEESAAALREPAESGTLEQVTHFVRYSESQATPDQVCAWIDRGAAGTGSRFWTLDPIDGTKGFLRGDQYAIALALILSGKVQVGVLGCPNLVEGHRSQMGGEGSLLVAVRGEGAWWASLMDETAAIKPVRVSDRDGAAEARLLRSFESGHTNVSQVDLFADALGVQAEPVRMDSQAKYAVLAAGYGEIYLRLLSPKQPDYREKIWDQAAGSLIVEEAGGRVTDLQGQPLDFSRGRTLANNRGVLATNGRLHEAALQGLKAIQA